MVQRTDELTSSRWARPPALRALSYFAYQYKRTWRGAVTVSFLYPVLYLAAMGVGLGSLVDHHVHQIDHVRYLVFIAPGLLASTAMQIGGNESMYPVMAAIKWVRTYFAMLATPLSVDDVLVGHLAWTAVRLFTVSTIYVGVMSAFSAALSPFVLIAIPAAMLTGLAFAAPISAYSATQETDTAFATLYRMVMIPMFLFSGTFFPITQLPAWLRGIAYATPLYHGVSLCRDLTLGRVATGADLEHALYLGALFALGFLLARRTYRRRLVV